MLKNRLRIALVFFFCATLLAGFVWSSLRMERLRDSGEIVLLELAPVDPLALLLGFYMELDYAMNRDIDGALFRRIPAEPDPQAFSPSENSFLAVVRLNEHRVAEFARLDDGAPPGPGEVKLSFRIRGQRCFTGASSYFFQEGYADAYAKAEYGEYRVAPNGAMLLTHLVDGQFRRIEPERQNAGVPAQPE